MRNYMEIHLTLPMDNFTHKLDSIMFIAKNNQVNTNLCTKNNMRSFIHFNFL